MIEICRKKSGSHTFVGVGSSSSLWKFKQDTSKRDIAAMFIIDELPFKFVENEGFWIFVNRIQPKFAIPCRNMLRNDCYKL
ncbi:hypothetical protein BT93_E1159 [Corymbia citriodora subsp. variegata]|nr:hypothetical protein BT93_E1159 [Corymbia citriodora subsp. variegata]